MDNNELKTIEVIAEHLQQVPYGQITLTINRHAGKTNNVVANEFENKIFVSNEDCIEWLLNGLKQLIDDKQSGVVNLEFTLKEGQLKKVTEHRRFPLAIEGGEK